MKLVAQIGLELMRMFQINFDKLHIFFAKASV